MTRTHLIQSEPRPSGTGLPRARAGVLHDLTVGKGHLVHQTDSLEGKRVYIQPSFIVAQKKNPESVFT